MSIFQSREHVWLKQQLSEDYCRIEDLNRAIRLSKTKEERLCYLKQFFDYIRTYPLLLFHHVSFRNSVIRRIKEEKKNIRIAKVLAHQSYHTKSPTERSNYEAELSRYIRPIENILQELEPMIHSIPNKKLK